MTLVRAPFSITVYLGKQFRHKLFAKPIEKKQLRVLGRRSGRILPISLIPRSHRRIEL